MLEAERIAKEADKKPLWEQLASKRDEKQAKFDAVRAAMFGAYCLSPDASTVRRVVHCSHKNPVRVHVANSMGNKYEWISGFSVSERTSYRRWSTGP